MPKKRVLSFKYAFEGVYAALKTEPNLVIQFFIGFVGLLMGLFFHITVFEWLIAIAVFTLVSSFELTNTAIEEIVDSFTQQTHPGAKKAKDVAAASVMVAFWAEVVIGILIFWPYLERAFLTQSL